MIALCLGGAKSVWSDLQAAEALLDGKPRLIVACNFAGIQYPGHLDAWATLHPELLFQWRRERASAGRNSDYRAFIYAGHGDCGFAELLPERWAASSGLYMAQAAFDRLGATGAILCGVPMAPEAQHIHHPGDWGEARRYWQGVLKAHAEAGDRIRSMSGETRELFGCPDGEWLASHGL